MAQVILITRTDGGVSIMRPGPGFTTPAKEIAAWQTASGLTAASWRIAEAEIPADRLDRNAWIDTGAALAIDSVKAAALAAARKLPSLA